MAKDEETKPRIIGSVAVAGFDRAFVAGDEDALADAIAKDEDKMIDVDHLTRTGAIANFGSKAEAPVEVVNKQRDADGSRADEKAVKGSEKTASEASKPKAAPVKKAGAKGEASTQRKGKK
jgi:hypothetical protein